MPFMVTDCPRCSLKNMTFDVKGYNNISPTNNKTFEEAEENLEPQEWCANYELFAVCRGCERATTFIISEFFDGDREIPIVNHKPLMEIDVINDAFEIKGFVRLSDNPSIDGKEMFIVAGRPLDALAAILEVLDRSKKEILIVDPYLDQKILTEFTKPFLGERKIKLLTCKGRIHKGKLHKNNCYDSLFIAFKKCSEQYKNKISTELRVASDGVLHDRLIIIDNKELYFVTQSFNAFAKRAHAVIASSVDPELKLEAYNDIWNNAKPIEL